MTARASAGETILVPARVPWMENTFEVHVESGGNAQEGGAYSAAVEVVYPGSHSFDLHQRRIELQREEEVAQR